RGRADEKNPVTADTPGALLGRVRKLLAKAEAEGVTPAEAEALTAKAAELMARYGIDRALLAAARPDTDRPADRVIDVPNPWSRPEPAGGQSTALVLAGRQHVVQSECRRAYPVTRTMRVTYTGSGYRDGYRQGQRADVGAARVRGTAGRALSR